MLQFSRIKKMCFFKRETFCIIQRKNEISMVKRFFFSVSFLAEILQGMISNFAEIIQGLTAQAYRNSARLDVQYGV